MNNKNISGVPKDREGLRNEHVIEICDYIISKSLSRINDNKSDPDHLKMSTSELKAVFDMAMDAWYLSANIIDRDRDVEELENAMEELRRLKEDEEGNEFET